MAKLETVRSGPRPTYVELPADAWDYGPDALEAATAAAIADHAARTGYTGPVLVGPVPCGSEEAWLRQYGPTAS